MSQVLALKYLRRTSNSSCWRLRRWMGRAGDHRKWLFEKVARLLRCWSQCVVSRYLPTTLPSSEPSGLEISQSTRSVSAKVYSSPDL